MLHSGPPSNACGISPSEPTQSKVNLDAGKDPKAIVSETPQHHPDAPNTSGAASFADKLERNQAITAWYHDIDEKLSAYMGTPELPTWARFAKHASYSAGVQLRNMHEVLQALDAVQDLVGSKSKLSVMAPQSSFRILYRAALEIGDLFRHQDLIQTVLLLGAMRAGAAPESIDKALDTNSQDGSHGISFSYALMQALPRIPTILGALPQIREELLLISEVVSDTNQKIYDFMAPRLQRFLDREVSDEIPRDSDEPSGKFLSHALSLYEEARRDSLTLNDPLLSSAKKEALESARVQKVERANVIATFGEQLYRVEPGFFRLRDLLDSLTAFMSFQTPGMNQRLAGESSQVNWGVLYERMGIDSSRAPNDPHEITPEKFPPLLPSKHPSFQGTISQVLLEGTRDSSLAMLLKQAPQEIAEPTTWG